MPNRPWVTLTGRLQLKRSRRRFAAGCLSSRACDDRSSEPLEFAVAARAFQRDRRARIPGRSLFARLAGTKLLVRAASRGTLAATSRFADVDCHSAFAVIGTTRIVAYVTPWWFPQQSPARDRRRSTSGAHACLSTAALSSHLFSSHGRPGRSTVLTPPRSWNAAASTSAMRLERVGGSFRFSASLACLAFELAARLPLRKVFCFRRG